MKKFLLQFFLFAVGIGATSPLAADILEGKLTITLYPVGSSGSTGSWKPLVVIPSGDVIEGPSVAYDSVDPVSMDVTYCPGPYIETGNYGIEIKNQIEGSQSESLVSSIVVEASCPGLTYDTMTYRQITPLSNGEATLYYYVLPTIPPL